ncbi:MAG: YbhB/YbcL family Raf kinase inhibitor-like protein [Pseudomonadota bacterium]
MRRKYYMVLILVLGTMGYTLMAYSQRTTVGDINGDGKIGLNEAIYSLQVTAGFKPAISFTLQSSAFANGQAIPAKYSCDSIDVSPPLSWTNPPAGTKRFVVIMDDADAIPVAGYTWDHWILYDIPTSTTALPENAGASGSGNLPSGAKHGINSWTTNNQYYRGPCPPQGSGVHRYYFVVYALDIETLTPVDTKKDGIDAAMRGHILGKAELVGTYVR